MSRSQAAALVEPSAALCCAAAAGSPHEQRRKHVLHAAETCFARSGFHGASMQEICAEAQMSPGALYRYFRSKDEIIDAIAEEDRIRNAALLTRLHAEGELLDRLTSLACNHLADMRRPGAAAVMAEVMAEGMRNPRIREKFMVNDCEVRDTIRSFLRSMSDIGAIDPVTDIESIMSFMCALIDGLVLRAAYEPDLTPERIEPMLRPVIAGLLRPVPASVSNDK
ncbi:TetR/AcrR family transcriptional regulator [Prosthecomicrobium sp. N25]|uniref:TetR/AcrR family transcriptional regulator n=1 Tax=Prosthecomicrobium sp. N25 TaxID=3129254 RepID=UPI003076F3D9